MVRQDSPPSCFGRLWSPNAKECTGGLDPTYTNERGQHVREPCHYKDACAATIRNNHTVTVPATNLTRNAQKPAYAAPAPPPPIRPIWPQQPVPYRHPMEPAVPGVPGPQHSNSFHIPQYLSVREPTTQPVARRLGIEILRSIVKAFGHTISNFVDTESFTK